MKILKDILYKVAIEALNGSTDNAVNHLHFDSRKIEANDVFVAIRGAVSDGHNFIDKAIALGATTIVCDVFPSELQKKVTYVLVKDILTLLWHLWRLIFMTILLKN